MGSASPGLTALPPGRLAWPDPTLLPPPRDPDPRSWGCPESPSPPSTPEQPLPAFCLHYFDMLYPEDTAWATKGAGEPSHSGAQGGREEARKEPEQCPIIDSQGLGLGPEGDLQGSLHLEEHSLEQVQSMVVGEVLKDIETACKLLNIAAGGCPPCSRGCGQGGMCWCGSQSHPAFEGGAQPCVRVWGSVGGGDGSWGAAAMCEDLEECGCSTAGGGDGSWLATLTPLRLQTRRTGAPGMCRSGSCGRSTSTGCRRSGSPSRSCRERTCVPCPRSSSASARPPAATSCTPTSTSGSLVGAREREGAGEGGRCCAAGGAPLMPRSSLPAAWMKEKAAPGDVRYCGEFSAGPTPASGRFGVLEGT